MEAGDGEDLTPFWVQSSTNVRGRETTAFFSSGFVVFLLLVTAVVFLVFVVPSISFSAQIIKPNSVKKGWDSLNIALVLVAVVFGFLSRNKNEDPDNSYCNDFQASPSKRNGSEKPSTPSTPNRWYKYSYDTIEGPKSNSPSSSQWYKNSDYQAKSEHRKSILTRNSSSYPDLRETSTHWSYGDYYERRYYDDGVDSGKIRDTGLDGDTVQGKTHRHRRHRSLEGVEHLRAPQQNKTVIVAALPSKSKEGGNPLRPETEASPPGIEEKSKMAMQTKSIEDPEFTYKRMAMKKERLNRKRNKDTESKDPDSTPPRAATSPPSPPRQRSTYRKRGGVTGSSTKDFLNSLYNKKKKQRQKSVDNLDPLLHETLAPLSFQVPPPSHHPPPPPAPPPPPTVFQNLFLSKKLNRKRTITVTLEPQTEFPSVPAPTPRELESTLPTHNPPKPIKMTTFDKLEEISNSGGESPLNRIPPPPPPPPPAAFYKSPAWKFVVQGDYVRVNSSNSSRSGSPDTDDGESDVTPSSVEAGAAASFRPSPLFCASPDVDTKDESFITNFRAKLKLEKIHSMNKRDVGLSGLGPGPGPTHFSQRK